MAGPDMSSLVSSVDVSTIVTAVSSVSVAIVGVWLTVKGIRIVLKAVRGIDDPYDGTGASGLDFRPLRGKGDGTF
jgi:hypothetical protein